MSVIQNITKQPNESKNEFIGEGTYGQVYKIKNTNKVKKVMDTFIEDDFNSTAFKELFFLSTYRKIPFIPTFRNANINNDEIEIEMDYCGENLEAISHKMSYVERIKILPILLIQFARILVWLENRNLIHLDIKPLNLCMDEKNQIYLIDWGFVTRSQNAKDTNGTVIFAEPLNLNNGIINCKYDMFSIGITIICFLTKSLKHYDEYMILCDDLKRGKLSKAKATAELIKITNLNSCAKDILNHPDGNGSDYLDLIYSMIDIDQKKRITPLRLYSSKLLSDKKPLFPLCILDINFRQSHSKLSELQKSKNEHTIGVIIDWMTKFKKAFNIEYSTGDAIKILFRYFDKNIIKKENLVLIASSSLYISCLINNEMVFISDIIRATSNLFNVEKFIETVLDVIKTLDYDLYSETINSEPEILPEMFKEFYLNKIDSTFNKNFLKIRSFCIKSEKDKTSVINSVKSFYRKINKNLIKTKDNSFFNSIVISYFNDLHLYDLPKDDEPDCFETEKYNVSDMFPQIERLEIKGNFIYNEIDNKGFKW